MVVILRNLSCFLCTFACVALPLARGSLGRLCPATGEARGAVPLALTARPCLPAEWAHARRARLGCGGAQPGGRAAGAQVRRGLRGLLPERQVHRLCGLPARHDRQRLGLEGERPRLRRPSTRSGAQGPVEESGSYWPESLHSTLLLRYILENDLTQKRGTV